VDLYLQYLFATGKSKQMMPSLDYVAGGFSRPGVTVLFGGDHGDKNCPISYKINLASPHERKRLNDLSHHCPVIQFANVQCSKDTFDLMDQTVMPSIKRQLIALKGSAVMVVYDKKNLSKCFRSYTVPSTINMSKLAFADHTDIPCKTTLMASFPFGDEGVEEPMFGYISVDDPMFYDVPHFQLGAKLIISQFNELFIGDLAFLAMSIGMNNSSGWHCLICAC
jgi:hypothetical protein